MSLAPTKPHKTSINWNKGAKGSSIDASLSTKHTLTFDGELLTNSDWSKRETPPSVTSEVKVQKVT